MNKLFFISFLLLIANVEYAQNDTLQLLNGEWYYIGSTHPDVRDFSKIYKITGVNENFLELLRLN